MSPIRRTWDFCVRCRVDQFIDNSIHIENDAFENLLTARRHLPLIAIVLKSRQTQKPCRHAVLEIMSQPSHASGANSFNGWALGLHSYRRVP